METEKKRLTAEKDGKDRNGIQIRKAEECQGGDERDERSSERERDSLLVVSDVAGP